MKGHLLGLKELEAMEIQDLLDKAQHYCEAKHIPPLLSNRFIANLFFENSTRTRFSFEVAEKRLGANVLNFQDTVSSMQKGETVYDTLKTLEAMGVETVVIRHAQNGILSQFIDRLNMNVINAGIGNEEHPTQALLDMLTMQQEFGSINQLSVAIIGDLKHSRVLRSNVYGLTKLGAKVIISGPKVYRPQEEEILNKCTWLPIDDAIGEADVVMMLRIQFERHQEQSLGISQHEYHQAYGLTEKRARFMKKGAIIMHPAPINRDVEIASALVESSKSRIFKQIHNGVFVRMAALARAHQHKIATAKSYVS